MGFSLSKFKEQAEASSKNDSPFFKLGPGQKVRLRPLVELDEDAVNFDPAKGTANFVKEYQNPVKFWLSIVDTYPTEGQCVGHEMVQKFGWYKAQNPDPDKGQHNDRSKNWNPKQRFYLPVLVDRLDGSDITVEVLQLTYGPRSYSQKFVDQHEAKGTIVDRWWFFERNEETKNIQNMEYKLVPDDPEDFDTSKYEIPDVNDAPYVNNVPYEQQRAFLQIDATYNGSQAQASVTPVANTPSPSEAPGAKAW